MSEECTEIILQEGSTDVLVLTEEHTLVLTECVGAPGPPGPQGEPGEPGDQGPPGNPGPPGGAAFLYTRAVPASTWIIVHNLNNWVHCTLMDENYRTIHADVVRTDIQTVTVTFNSPKTGFAYLS